MATPESSRPPPPLPDHLLELILDRLPPEDPSSLLRASLVCKHWRDLIYDPKFLPNLLELGRAPQMLGFLYHSESQGRREYVPTSPFSFPLPDFSGWDLHGYRHGRAVFQSTRRIEDHNFPQDISLLVWVPFTGQRTEVPAPFKLVSSYATVICAADGCDHRNCHGGPFFIVLVSCDPEHENRELQFVSSACVYSSETRAWGKVASTNGVPFICNAPAVLVGKSLLYFLSVCGNILEYDLARHSLVRIKPPRHHEEAAWKKRMILVQAEDAGLGIALVKPDPDTHGFSDDGCDCLCLLSRKVSQGGGAKWVKLGVIYLEDLFSHVRASTSPNRDMTAYLIGFAEGANTVFVSTYEHDDIFAVELQSKWARKVYQCHWGIDCLAPVLSSYTTGPALLAPQGEHHNLMAPVLSSSDEENDEEGGWEQDAQLRFDKGLKAIEERRFVAAVDHLRYALDLRVAHYDDLSPKCASTYYQYGRALLKKAQKAANHFSIVPKSPPYEKTVEGTSSGPDTTSSENSDSEEGQNSNGEYEDDRNGDTDKDGNEIACNDIDSDLDRASKMLEVARRIVEENEVNTVETFRILSALTEVFMEKRKR